MGGAGCSGGTGGVAGREGGWLGWFGLRLAIVVSVVDWLAVDCRWCRVSVVRLKPACLKPPSSLLLLKKKIFLMNFKGKIENDFVILAKMITSRPE